MLVSSSAGTGVAGFDSVFLGFAAAFPKACIIPEDPPRFNDGTGFFVGAAAEADGLEGASLGSSLTFVGGAGLLIVGFVSCFWLIA